MAPTALTGPQIFRWRPNEPGGEPHLLRQDDWYDGYFLPKDTIVITSTWSVHHDESEYETPGKFIPERWFDNEFGTKTAGDPADNEQRRPTYVSYPILQDQLSGSPSLCVPLEEVRFGSSLQCAP